MARTPNVISEYDPLELDRIESEKAQQRYYAPGWARQQDYDDQSGENN
jgi:hypothetical protein